MWVPLHQHSQYSVLDATMSVEEMAKKASHHGISACALTDHGNMHGAIDFYKACKEVSVKPILGCEVYIAKESRFDKKKIKGKTAHHLILLSKDKEGYQNLCRLTSLGYLEGFYYHPRIDKELLKKYSKGLVCLSACLSGMVAHAALEGSYEEFIEEIKWHRDLFGEDYYLELQRHTMCSEKIKELDETWLQNDYEEFISKQEKVNDLLREASQKLGIKCVATNDAHYLDCCDWKPHEILLNIQSGEAVEIWEKNNQFRIPNPKRRVYSSRECYFKSPEEMKLLFQDFPEAISHTLEVAEKCNLALDFKTKHYPVYIPPHLEGKSFTAQEQKKETEAFLGKLCEEGIEKRYKAENLEKVRIKYPGKDPLEVVRERLQGEMEIITSKEMCDYLLIVWDFVNWAKRHEIPVGPGRGSGAGSIILYLIGVTDIEPLSLHLFFERFINPERLSYPDIDVDICMARRQEVIDYTVSKYGKECVAQIITFGTMKARMTIKDVGRVLSIPLSKVNQIASFVPEEPTMTLDRALEIDADLHRMYTSDPDAKNIIDYGKRIEGSIRNLGIHAAGIIVSRDPLMDHIPICVTKDSEMAVTQYSMKPLELVGMLKIDFLGLKTLTSIQLAVDSIEKNDKRKIDWMNLPLEDQTTFFLLHQGKTLGVFQMESGGMQELSRQLKPDKFEEIIAIGALYRPGPMDMIPSFIQRKHGKENIDYDHPLLEPILSETYGIMVYQEQVMHIATKLAGYSLGEGDVLRRAMGKKDKNQMEKEREKFLSGAIKNGITKEVATIIFDKMEKFAAYGFNKSHAAAYGYLTYVTAYLKAHYPREWMAALMTCDRDDVEKVAKYIRECKGMNIAILPPDINIAGVEFVATQKGIRFAMAAIKGVGEGIVDQIVQERTKQGPFKNLYDFFQRMVPYRVGKKTVECLVDAGAFDFTNWSRDALRESIEVMHEMAAKEVKEKASGVMTLFSLLDENEPPLFSNPPDVLKVTTRSELLKREKELLGFFLTSHPLEEFDKILNEHSCASFLEIESSQLPAVFRVAFIIESVSIKIASRTQKKFAILTVSDGNESKELPIWPDFFEEKHSLLQENKMILSVLSAENKEGKFRLSVIWMDDLEKIDDAMIEASEKAIKNAKNKWTRPSSGSFISPTKEKKPMHSHSQAPYVLKAHLAQLRLSHILHLKEAFSECQGLTPLKIEFLEDEKISWVLHLTEGINLSQLSSHSRLVKLLELRIVELKNEERSLS